MIHSRGSKNLVRAVESQVIPYNVDVKWILLNSSVSLTSNKRQQVTSKSGE